MPTRNQLGLYFRLAYKMRKTRFKDISTYGFSEATDLEKPMQSASDVRPK